MTTPISIKRCPFCGAAPRVIDDDSYGSCQVFCVCEHEPFIQRWATHKDEAIAAWNKRAFLAEIERLREALIGILNASPDLEYRESPSIDHYVEVLCEVKNIAAKGLGEERARPALPEEPTPPEGGVDR